MGMRAAGLLTPWLVVGCLAHLGLHLGVVHDGCRALALASWRSLVSRERTILGFAETGLEVVEREIAHLVLQAAEIHGGGVVSGYLADACTLRLSAGRRWLGT